MSGIKKQEIIAFIVGVIIGGLFTNTLLPILHTDTHNHDKHQITQPDEEYHVHSDFLIYVNDEKIDLTDDKYMTTGTQKLHSDTHLHDGNGEVQHMHAPGITFAEFLESLSIELTDNCLIIAENSYCSNDYKQLLLFVNNEVYSEPITDYEAADEDRVLLYFGNPDSENISAYLEEIKHDACYYSGTCPERGIAPSESCGLTCEL